VTLLADDPTLWDVVFRESPARVRFVRNLVKICGNDVLDVGCATGTLCGLLRKADVNAVGIDINPQFIAAAKAKDPGGEYFVANMRSFRLRRRFDLILCLGTTFSYNLTNGDITATLANIRRHLNPTGKIMIDVVNAVAFTGPSPFKTRTEHKFDRCGFRATAMIRHRLNLKQQTMSEQVSWKIEGRRTIRDDEESLRLLFPQEFTFHLESAGFCEVDLTDGYTGESETFGGRRLIAVAKAR
jgi:SAM-dependent methyltransferase